MKEIAWHFALSLMGISTAELLFHIVTGDPFDFRGVFDAAFFITAGAFMYRVAK